jgi:HAAS domain-containing protein
MQRPKIISDYLDRLTRELSFDIPLARRVRQEVEDHLSEAAAAEPEAAAGEAQLRAIRNFGDPHIIAGEYAAQSLFRHTRRLGAFTILVTAGILLAMNARGAWYGWIRWEASADLQAARKIGLSIDLYAFLIVLAIGVIGWAYVGTRRMSATFNTACRDEQKRCMFLYAAIAGPLIASVITDAILTGLRLSEAPFRVTALVPLLSMAAEIAFAAVLVVQIRNVMKRMALASSLFCR